VIDGLYRWVETWERANAPLNLASQSHRFTPALNGQIQRALALTPADGRFVDINIFNGTQVSTFGARVLGCAPGNGKLNCRFYEEELARLQVKLVKMPYWIRSAGVERVMGFCSPQEMDQFLRSCPDFERMLVDSGIMPHGPGGPQSRGGILRGQGRDVRPHQRPRSALVHGGGR
jgi:hypothetical protein